MHPPGGAAERVATAESESRTPHLGWGLSGASLQRPRPTWGRPLPSPPPQGHAVWPVPLSDVLAQPWSEGATFCTGTPPLPWARPAQPWEPAGPRGACSGGPCIPDALRASLGGLSGWVPGGPGPLRAPRPAGDAHPLSPDPRFYQEIQERGLNTSHESDDDLLDEAPSPEGTQKVDVHVVVKSYRPPQITWSQLPEVGPGWRERPFSRARGWSSR